MTSVGSVEICLVEDTTAMEVDIVGQEDATYLERGMGAVGIGQQDENEVEQIFFDRMWQDLQIGSDHEFFMLQRLFDVDLRRLEPRTVSYINHIFKSTGAVILFLQCCLPSIIKKEKSFREARTLLEDVLKQLLIQLHRECLRTESVLLLTVRFVFYMFKYNYS